MLSFETNAGTQFTGFASRALEYAAAMHARSTADETAIQAVEIAIDGIAIVISVADHRVLGAPGSDSSSGGANAAPSAEQRRFDVVSPLLHRHLATALATSGSAPVVLHDKRAGRDPAVQRLGRALIAAHKSDEAVDAITLDALIHALVTRWLYVRSRYDAPGSGRPTTALPKWRLKRVVAHVAEHLADRITLADMAAAAGLSRMHFAAQFRAATGVRPHDYVLRRRVECAQDMLLGSHQSLVATALGVGFQTQAHFTTVFKRIVGETPDRWRRANRGVAHVLKAAA